MEVYLVGGAVRDKMLGIPVTDRDWVVVGATPAEMIAKGFKPVGKDFPVFLHPETKEEYALARKERKTGLGYHGFDFNTDPSVTLEDDMERRDLTINAMAEDEDGELVDLYDGERDIEDRLLRHISPAFAEDPVRLLRVARFYARFAELGFQIADETVLLMRQLVERGEVDALVPERVWKELESSLTATRPSLFLEALRQCGALHRMFPALDRLHKTPHPIGSGGAASITTRLMDKAAASKRPTPIVFACMCHVLSEREINHLAQIYKIPNDHHHLAVLVARHLLDCVHNDDMDAELLLEIFTKADAFRQLKRFVAFLEVGELVSNSLSLNNRVPQIRKTLQACLNIDARPLKERGLSGTEIGKALKQIRLERIQQVLA